MILKPIPLTNKREISQETVIRGQWWVLWDGRHRERHTVKPLPQLSR